VKCWGNGEFGELGNGTNSDGDGFVADNLSLAMRHPRAALARQALESFGIDINASENVVSLPAFRSSPNPGGATAHIGPTLMNRYYDRVNDLVVNAATREDALRILRDIGVSLQEGTFP
jgi:hypothetical protein